ncbi:tetratricopeptide repeat protein [Nitrospinae bacterium AH_259_B05_G02_I21]|nr:tetratricopeptide repeat protein [Nitrospinae bacterium AH_259_B05_G02_I21]MDA2931785.1 tetratricopeptide repeat protein [Nitrospinae bacterium AH-259-F20]
MEHKDFDLLMEKGQEAFTSGRYEAALEAYIEATRLNPDHARANLWLGVAYGSLERYKEAARACKKAVRLEPEDATARFYLGVACARLDRDEAAIRQLMMALRLEPENPEAHYWLGFSYGNLGRYKEAERELRKAINLEPENTEAHFYLGLAYLSLWNHDGVEEQYEILRELDDEVADKFLGLFNNLTVNRELAALRMMLNLAAKATPKVDESFTDAIIKQCPYCGHEASIKNFGTWEREGKRGLLGRTPEGFIIFLCPQCEEIIKYDSLSNEFLKQS